MTEFQVVLYRKDIAKLIGRTTKTLDKWIKDGYFPQGKYVRGRPCWTKSAVDKWLAEFNRREA